MSITEAVHISEPALGMGTGVVGVHAVVGVDVGSKPVQGGGVVQRGGEVR
jgi:hypothetical protein